MKFRIESGIDENGFGYLRIHGEEKQRIEDFMQMALFAIVEDIRERSGWTKELVIKRINDSLLEWSYGDTEVSFSEHQPS